MPKEPTSLFNLGEDFLPNNGALPEPQTQEGSPADAAPAEGSQKGIEVGLDNFIVTGLSLQSKTNEHLITIAKNQVGLAMQNNEMIRLLKVIAGEAPHPEPLIEDPENGR